MYKCFLSKSSPDACSVCLCFILDVHLSVVLFFSRANPVASFVVSLALQRRISVEYLVVHAVVHIFMVIETSFHPGMPADGEHSILFVGVECSSH